MWSESATSRIEPMSSGNEDLTTDLSSLDGSAYLQIARDVERFEKAWTDGAPFPLKDLLRDRPEAFHGELLRHALAVELAYRRQRGDMPSVASYDWRFLMHLEAIQQAFTEPAAAQGGSPPPPQSPSPPRPFPATLGKYTVLGRLGDGGQGSTFLARDPDLGHIVVLKRYHGQASGAALKEGQALCRIQSRHTARCLGVEREGGDLYLVMEYIPGRSLAEVLRATPPRPDAAAHLILLVVGLWPHVFPPHQPPPVVPAPTPAPPPAPLSGELTVRVWSREGGGKRGWKADEPGALPVLAGEQIHLEARLTRPAYAYLLWLDGQGQAISLHPWQGRTFNSRPALEAATTALHSPAELDRGWPMTGKHQAA
jgi:hypothetical protein